jgi:uncharacterized membrane protein YheB (UPF0754 family)
MSLHSSILIIVIASAGGYCIAALFSWLIFRPFVPIKMAGFVFQGFVPSIIPGFASYLAAAIGEKILSEDIVGKAFDDPKLLQQLRPEMEGHIDIFLRDKLPAAFPLLAGMMGEKTKATLKDAFLTEVETIFPSVMKSFSGKLLSRLEPQAIIEKQLAGINLGEVEKMAKRKAGRQMLYLRLAGAFTGLLLGLVQVLIINLFS